MAEVRENFNAFYLLDYKQDLLSENEMGAVYVTLQKGDLVVGSYTMCSLFSSTCYGNAN